jgi:hypothetical protein
LGENLIAEGKIVERALQRALAQIKRAAIVVGAPEREPLLQREVVVGHRLVVLALELVGPPPQVQHGDIVGIGREGGGEIGDGMVIGALAHIAVGTHSERPGQILGREPAGVEQFLAGASRCATSI